MMRIIFKSVFRPPPWIFRIYIESTDTLQAAIGTDRQINLSIFYSYDDKGISTLYHPLRPPPPPPPLELNPDAPDNVVDADVDDVDNDADDDFNDDADDKNSQR